MGRFKTLHGNYVIVDTNNELSFIAVDAGGVASLLGISRDKVHNLFRKNVKMCRVDSFIISKSPYFISSRRGGDMRAKRK